MNGYKQTAHETKLALLYQIDGRTEEEYFKNAVFNSVCLGICNNAGCDYTTDIETDQTRGWCEVCKTPTVKSGLIMAGII